MEKRINQLINEFKIQARHPSAGDPFISAFFKAVVEITKKDKKIINLIIQVQDKRNKAGNYLTNLHAVYLPINVINYIMIFKKKLTNYPYIAKLKLNEVSGWILLINEMLTKHLVEFRKLLTEKNIQQNITQRGIAFPFITNKLFQNKKLKIADLGCSANLVWSHFIYQSKFLPIIDRTTYKKKSSLINEFSNKKISIAEVTGVDQKYPLTNDESKKWLLACRHPNEVKSELIKKAQIKLTKLMKLKNSKIIIGDMANPPLKKNYFDLITINNALYQIPKSQRKAVLQNTINLLNQESGLLIIQDNCYINKKQELILTDSRNYFTYRVCLSGPIIMKLFNSSWIELIKYKTTRCLEVKSGKDFEKFLDVVGK